MSDKVREHLIGLGCPEPDMIFDAMCLSPASDREALNIEDCPLHERGRDGQYLRGVYAWVEEGENDESAKVMYVGKAVRLRNRLTAHFTRCSPFLNQWFDERWDEVRSWLPHVAVWFSSEPASMESKMIKTLRPCYNRRDE